MSSVTNAYTVLTSDDTDLSEEHTGGGFGNEAEQKRSRWCAALDAASRTAKNNAGMLLVAGAQAFFSLMNLAVKELSSIDPPVSTLELIAVRMGITYVCGLAYMLFVGVPDPLLGPKGVRLLLFCRGLSGFVGLIGLYYSLAFLSLSDATVITFLAPPCTGIAGALFLKESFTKKQALASLFGLSGVILIARPAFLFGNTVHTSYSTSIDTNTVQSVGNSEKATPTERLIAVGVALIGMLASTGTYIFLRAIGTRRAHTFHALTLYSAYSVIGSIIGMVVTKTPFIIPTRLDWAMLFIMIGVCGFFAQILLTMGLQRETASRGSMASYSQLVFAIILEQIFFKSRTSVLSVIGTFMIVSSAVYVALTKEQSNKIKSDIIRLDTIQEEGLEEGLLSAGEQIKDTISSPRRTSNENSRYGLKSPSYANLDKSIEEPKAPGLEGGTKSLS